MKLESFARTLFNSFLNTKVSNPNLLLLMKEMRSNTKAAMKSGKCDCHIVRSYHNRS